MLKSGFLDTSHVKVLSVKYGDFRVEFQLTGGSDGINDVATGY